MADFNLSELLPFYLDETDENIAALNDALLRLETDPADAGALAEALRMFHSIKGASVVMGFDAVNHLTHHMESLFEELRNRRRALDRPLLDLTFRCLDELRDYHRELRAEGQTTRDLENLTREVNEAINAPRATAQPEPKPDPGAASIPNPNPNPEPLVDDNGSRVWVTVEFEPNLQLVDMKARLVANRLSTRGRVTATRPPLNRLEETEPLERFSVQLAGIDDAESLRALADVDGVANILIEGPTADARAPAQDARSGRAGDLGPLAEPEGPTAHAPRSPIEPISEPAPDPDPDPESEPEPVMALAPRPPGGGSKRVKIVETIRVDSDRLDNLMNLTGELIINKARFIDVARGFDEALRGSNAKTLAGETEERIDALLRGLDQIVGAEAGNAAVDRWAAQARRLRDNFRRIGLELDRLRRGRDQLKLLTEAIHGLGRVADGLQKGVLETRMVPIGPWFERFRRVVRDIGHSSGKEVSLRITGEKTELDKRMIDELSDPLIHMVRNSVDHGLEPPDVREAAGKPRIGTISLQAAQRGNSVVVTVADDGRGIDHERVRKTLVERGLATKAEADRMTERELLPQIWRPGFSTAKTVSEISGRGVGMDIVKDRIEKLNGVVDVRSTPGRGTLFTIRLPLTLAIMSSLLTRIFDEVYALPLDDIDEIVEIRPHQVFSVRGRPTIEVRGRIVALVSLGDLFLWGGERHPGAAASLEFQGGAEPLRVVVVQNGETTIGLIVDELIGMREVVLKSLDRNYRAVPGLSGASILGDGRVSLILDVDALIALAAAREPKEAEANMA